MLLSFLVVSCTTVSERSAKLVCLMKEDKRFGQENVQSFATQRETFDAHSITSSRVVASRLS